MTSSRFAGGLRRRRACRGPGARAVVRAAGAGLVVGALLGVTACSSTQTPQASPTPGSVGSALATMYATQAPSFGGWPTLDATPSGATVLPWELVRVEGDQVFLAVTVPGCLDPVGAVVRETASTVSVQMVSDAGVRPTVCAHPGSTVVGYVRTTAPVGGRKLLHG